MKTGGFLNELNSEIEKLVHISVYNRLVSWRKSWLVSIMNSTEEQTSTTEKLLDLNKKSKTRKEVRIAFTTLELFNAHDFYDNVLIP